MLQIESYLKKQINACLKELNYPIVPYQFDRPKLEQHGDLSVNVAMLLAQELARPPRRVAQTIKENLELDTKLISRVEIAGPGFINFFFSPALFHRETVEILNLKDNYGRFETFRGKKAQVEFVSANPTGPLTVGHGRQGVLGDTVANLLQWVGYTVIREYYFNNAGRQMRVLADSVRLRYLELLGQKIDFPDDYYQGEYIRDIARKILDLHGDALKDSENLETFKKVAEEEIFRDIKDTLRRIQIQFDVFFNELDLYESGEIEEVVRLLKEKGFAYEKDGALWFKATEFGLDKDRVIIKSTGEPTYRLPDIAYHRNKLERGFDLIVDLFGADHIATYPDVLAGLQALGYDVSRIKVLIHQFVTLYAGKEKLKMSTRRANFVTLDELIDEVGPDATRWFFLMRSMQSHLNFDLSLAKTQSEENPVYYNQYAHARICSILRKAEEKNIRLASPAPLHRLQEKAEFDLMRKLMDFPRIVWRSATEYQPHLLTEYLSEVSTAFHKFYTECWVIGGDVELTQARLALCVATKTVLANGFAIIGVHAPERM